MNRHMVLRIALALALIGAVIGLGTLAFNAGVSQGLAMGVQTAAGDSVKAPQTVYLLPYGQPWFGFGALFCFGVLAFFLILFLVFGAARTFSRRGRWGEYGWHHGPWGARPGDGAAESARPVPPIFEEWHRRAHAAPPEEKTKV